MLGIDCVAGLKSLKRVQERLLLQHSCSKRLQHFRDVGTVGRLIIKNSSSRSEVKPAQTWKTSCVCCKGKAKNVTQAFGGARKIMGESQILNTE